MSCGGDEGATFYHTAMDREMGSSSSVGRRHKTDLCQQCEQLGSLHHVRLHEYRHHGNHDSTVVCILFSWELFCYFTRTANCSPRAFDAKTHQLAVRACAIPPPSAHARDQSRTTPFFPPSSAADWSSLLSSNVGSRKKKRDETCERESY